MVYILAVYYSDVWLDMVPSYIISGPHFFAHEISKLSQIADIQQLMQDVDHTPLAGAPRLGDLVTVNGPINSRYSSEASGKLIYYRGQVG